MSYSEKESDNGMKKIFESGWVHYDECSDKVHVFQFENEDEFFEFSDMNHMERCEYFNVFDNTGSFIEPGGTYKEYEFEYNMSFVTMFERIGLNV